MKEPILNKDLELLDKLTTEVVKENPETEKVKQYMKKAGLDYSEDPIERINLVLNEIQFYIDEGKSND